MQNNPPTYKKHITFVSFMKGGPWGGSEELWCRVAAKLLAKEQKVSTLTKFWYPAPQKITDIQRHGAQVYFYNGPNGNRIIKNILIHFGIRKRRSWQPVFESDYFVFSCSTAFDFIQSNDILKELMALKKPYIIINQHNFETGNIVKDRFAQYALDFCNNARRIYFVSERNCQAAQRQLACSFLNAALINNPVNIKQAGILPMKQDGQLKLACVARLDCAFKGQDLLLQALGSDIWRQRDFELNFYGQGPDGEYLKRLIAFYHLQDKVFLKGYEQDIESIWIENHALVLPSISEGTSLALMEASLLGRPSVVTDVGGSKDYVQHGLTGYITQSVTPQAIDDCLQLLWANRANLVAMGKAAYTHGLSITNLNPENEVIAFIEAQP